jgi:hypothetical protein
MLGSQQSFLLACYSSALRGQCDFYEFRSMAPNDTSIFIVDSDLWTCSKKIIMSNPPSSGHPHESSSSTQLRYDFEFKYIHDGPKMHALLGAHTGNVSFPLQHPTINRTTRNSQFPSDISFLTAEIPSDDDNEDEDEENLIEQHHHQATLIAEYQWKCIWCSSFTTETSDAPISVLGFDLSNTIDYTAVDYAGTIRIHIHSSTSRICVSISATTAADTIFFTCPLIDRPIDHHHRCTMERGDVREAPFVPYTNSSIEYAGGATSHLPTAAATLRTAEFSVIVDSRMYET